VTFLLEKGAEVARDLVGASFLSSPGLARAAGSRGYGSHTARMQSDSDTAQAPRLPAPPALSRRAWAVLVAMYATGLVLSGWFSSYDVWTRPIAPCLTMLNSLLSWLLLWVALSALRVEPSRKLAGTLLVPLAWNTLMISQFTLVGLLLIPLEIVVAVVILRRKVSLSWITALLVAGATRMLSMGLVYAAKPAVVSWFPYGG
jgi:hypothetical protein